MVEQDHNIRDLSVAFELRLYNTLSGHIEAGHAGQRLELPAGSTIQDLMERLGIAAGEVFLVLVNGRDITRGLYGDVRTDYYIQDDDVIALSGPVPYSWGYGAPIV